MTRALLAVASILLLTAAAHAQTPEAPPATPAETAPVPDAAPPPPPPEVAPPPPAPPPPAPVPPDPSLSAARHSRFSAGPGGPFFIFTEVLAGTVTGGLIGASTGADDGVYLGVIGGGALLGTLAGFYQYFVPVGTMEAALATLGAGSGFLAALGLGMAADLTQRNVAWSSFFLTQVGAMTPLLLTLGEGDVSVEDAALIGMTTLYATAVTGLTMWIITASTTFEPHAMLFAPAAGMAIGGVLASFLELEPGRVFKLTALPLGVGLILLYVGGLAQSPAIAPATALIGIAATFALTALFTDPAAAPPDRRRRAEVEGLAPTVLVLPPAGPRAPAAVLPGLLGSF